MKSTAVAVSVFVAASAGATRQSEPCAAFAPSAPILEVGTFSDMRYTKEHAYGHTVSLWRSGDCLFGIFAWSGGLAGDTSIGELQAVRHDSGTGALAFSARLTIGVFKLPGAAVDQPTHDVFTFGGRLEATRLAGDLIHVNQADPASAAVRTTIVLRAAPRDAPGLPGPATYAAWRDKWRPILMSRGPKW